MASLRVIIALFVASVALIPKCYAFYWKLQPGVRFYDGPVGNSNSINTVTVVGDSYAGYNGQYVDINSAKLVIIEEARFGCDRTLSKNATDAINAVAGSEFVIMMPFDTSACSDYRKAYVAQHIGATGVLFYYNERSREPNFSKGDREKLAILVAVIELPDDNLEKLLDGRNYVSITSKYVQALPTSQTFYFVVFSFCILTLLSCLWFILSYVRKCRSNAVRRRRRVSIHMCVCISCQVPILKEYVFLLRL